MSYTLQLFRRSFIFSNIWRNSGGQRYTELRNFSLYEGSTDVDSFDSSRYRNEACIRGTVISEPVSFEMPTFRIAEFHLNVNERYKGSMFNLKVSTASSSNSVMVDFIMDNIEPSQLVEVKGSYRIKSYRVTDGLETKYHSYQSIHPKSISIIKSSDEVLTETEPALTGIEIH